MERVYVYISTVDNKNEEVADRNLYFLVPIDLTFSGEFYLHLIEERLSLGLHWAHIYVLTEREAEALGKDIRWEVFG